jgi:hypothetical protein
MNILIVANPTSAATDYYRTTGPFTRLAQRSPGITLQVEYPQNVKWHHMYAADALIFQRPNGDDILTLMAEARRMGKKLIVDIDDLLHGLTDANPASRHFNAPNIISTMDSALGLADHLIVSTPFLAEFYTPKCTCPITVIPNCPDLQSTPFTPIQAQHAPLRVFWRGSTTHLYDLYTIEKVWNVMGTDKSYSLMFIGIEKFMLPWYQGNAVFVPWQTLFQLFEGMGNSGIDLGIYPLTLDDFNRSKSNIFAMEMLCAGAPVLAPEGLPEWQHPGVLPYKNPMHLQVLLSEIRSGKIEKEKEVEAGRQWIAEYRDLNKHNETRSQIIHNL